MRLSAALTATPGELFRLEDEMVEFGGHNLVNRLRDRKQVSFRRGVGGTTAVTHASGTTLLRVADAVASSASAETFADPFSAGGVQTIRLLGPFHVTFETPGIAGDEDGAVLTELDAGTLVIHVAVVPTAAWNGGDLTALDIYIGGEDFGPPDDNFRTITGDPFVVAELNPRTGGGSTGGLARAVFGAVTTDGALLIQGDGAATEGAADIYALIAEPA